MMRILKRIWHWGWHRSEWPGVYFDSANCPQCQEWAQKHVVTL